MSACIISHTNCSNYCKNQKIDCNISVHKYALASRSEFNILKLKITFENSLNCCLFLLEITFSLSFTLIRKYSKQLITTLTNRVQISRYRSNFTTPAYRYKNSLSIVTYQLHFMTIYKNLFK